LESVNADAIIAHGGYLFTTQLEKKEEKLDRADGQEKEREKKPSAVPTVMECLFLKNSCRPPPSFLLLASSPKH
jgi:hypothetical protein